MFFWRLRRKNNEKTWVIELDLSCIRCIFKEMKNIYEKLMSIFII